MCRMLKQIGATRKRLLNQLLAAVAAGILVSYTRCDTTRSYLNGTFPGIDLLHIGLAFTGVTILFGALRYDSALIVLLSSAIGAEVFLAGCQVVRNVYCPHCLAFGSILFLQLFINFDRKKTRISVIAMVVSVMLFPFFFACSTIPSYGDGERGFPCLPNAESDAGRGPGKGIEMAHYPEAGWGSFHFEENKQVAGNT